MDDVLLGMLQSLDPSILIVVGGFSLFGLVMGAIPGLTATTGAALLVPITFFMGPLEAMAAVIAMAATAIFAGDVPAFLLRIPGTPASAAYTDDGYHFTCAGRAKFALMTSCMASITGGVFAAIVFAIGAPALARFALDFSFVEYFWLACLGLSCAAFIGSSDPVKGVASLLIGLGISVVGLDVITGQPRFTFGIDDLSGGISFIPALVGMFAISQILRTTISNEPGAAWNAPAKPKDGRKDEGIFQILLDMLKFPKQLLRGSTLGFMIGALPGAGADIAAWVSYGISQRFSKTPEKYGKGSQEGIIEAASSNNSAVGGAWVPALVLGIPGDTITAIALGVLIMKGVQPGPAIFVDQPVMVGKLIGVFLLSNLILFPVSLLVVSGAKYLLRVPRPVMDGFILLLSLIGSYAITNSMLGVWIMLGMGIVGFLMESVKIPLAPMILGLVLGPMIEANLLRSLIKSGGDPSILWSRPIALCLAVFTIGSILWVVAAPLVRATRKFCSNRKLGSLT